MYNVVALMPATESSPVKAGFSTQFVKHLSAAKDHFMRATLSGVAIALTCNGIDNAIVRRQTGTFIPQVPGALNERLLNMADRYSKGLNVAVAKQVVLSCSLVLSMIALEDLTQDLCGEGPISKMLTGVGAGAIQAYVSNPLATVLVRLQTGAEAIKPSCGFKMSDFLAGASSTAFRNSLFWALLFSSTHSVDEALKKRGLDSSSLAAATPVFCSLAASAVTAPIATLENPTPITKLRSYYKY
ncbi:MAG: hypothetical protein K0S29_747 [Gammaproteobacteria bacterium]|nr:hypothetical protein [Gammaproteobacteria bacterium]